MKYSPGTLHNLCLICSLETDFKTFPNWNVSHSLLGQLWRRQLWIWFVYHYELFRSILDILYVIKISYSQFPFQGCENFLVSCNKLEIGDIYLRCSSVLSWHTSSKSKAAMSLVLQLPIVLRIQFSHYSTSIISMHKCSSSLVSLYRHVHIYVLCCIVAILVVLL